MMARKYLRPVRAVIAALGLLVTPAAAALMATTAAHAQETARAYDTIIRGGTIVDGSGLAPYQGDVAIEGGHIAAVGDLQDAQAVAVVEAEGMIVAPGFINIHSHARPDAVGTAVNMLTQGVTTEITNADGHGTTDITTQLTGFRKQGLAENIGLYIGFNAIWSEVVGTKDRRALPAEIGRMRGLVGSNLAQGAWGVASGLDYKPGYFADADEVIAVVSPARGWRTNFPNHDRLRPEENYSSLMGMAETIEIAEQAGLTPVITHMKTQGAEQGNAPAVLAMFDRAAARGTYVAADLYPYVAGLSGLALNLPGWALAGGREAMLQRFADPETRARIVEEAERAMRQRWGGPEGVYLLKSGQELTDVVARMNVRPGEAVVRLLEEEGEDEGHRAIFRYGEESDVAAFHQYRNSALSCDCGASLGKRGHPRTWGSFPRQLGRYVREQELLTWPDAIRKMTALPATIIGMIDRGYLAPGMAADITVFDPRTVRDHATYEEPTKPSEGIRQVFVNGRQALRDGVPVGAQGGEVVLRRSYMPTRPMTPTDMSRSVAGGGSVADGALRYDLSFAVSQQPGERFATGTIRLVDALSGLTWNAERLGTIQTAPGWASLTAMLRDPAGNRRAATIVYDSADASAGPATPGLVVRMGRAELTGAPNGEITIAAQ